MAGTAHLEDAPRVDPEASGSLLVGQRSAAADAATEAQPLRTAALVRLLHNALRVDEACDADVADLGEDSGHRVVRKGARKAKIPLGVAVVLAENRADMAGAGFLP